MDLFVLKDEKGQALPIVLLIILMSAFFVGPALVYANSSIIAQRIAKETLVDEYSADSAITYVMWKLLDLNYSANPPATETVIINGISSTVNITKVPPPGGLNDYSVEIGPISKRVDEDHQVWLVVSTTDLSHSGIYMAYDTVNFPSQITIPWRDAGPVTYYFHNTPTPPTGDTTIPVINADINRDALPMNTTPSNTATLYNYDVNHDVLIPLSGRWIEPVVNSPKCANQVDLPPTQRVVWRSPTLTDDDRIDGKIVITWWWGLPDNQLGAHGITWWLCDFDTDKAFKVTGQGNPENILVGTGAYDLTSINIWIAPYDLSAAARNKRIDSRVDKINSTTIKQKSWQIKQN